MAPLGPMMDFIVWVRPAWSSAEKSGTGLPASGPVLMFCPYKAATTANEDHEIRRIRSQDTSTRRALTRRVGPSVATVLRAPRGMASSPTPARKDSRARTVLGSRRLAGRGLFRSRLLGRFLGRFGRAFRCRRLLRPELRPSLSGGGGNALARGGAHIPFLRGRLFGLVELGPPFLLRSRNPLSRSRAQRTLPGGGSRRCLGEGGAGGRLTLQLAAKLSHLRVDLVQLVLIAYQRRLKSLGI